MVSAKLKASTTSGPAPLTVKFVCNFTGKAPFYPQICFGDGVCRDIVTRSRTWEVVHTYEKPGTYVAKLTVIDSTWEEAHDEVTITVGKGFFTIAVVEGKGTVCVSWRVTGGYAPKICTSTERKVEVSGTVRVEVDAEPAEGYEFDFLWVDGKKITKLPATVDVKPGTLVGAYFKRKAISLTVIPQEGGDVKVRIDGGEYLAKELVKTVYKVYPGAKITLQAQPKEGYEFLRFVIGSKVVTDPTYSFTIKEDTLVGAYFKKKEVPPPPTPECREGETKCVDSDLYVCKAGKWVLKERDSFECKLKKWMPYLVLGGFGVAALTVLAVALKEER